MPHSPTVTHFRDSCKSVLWLPLSDILAQIPKEIIRISYFMATITSGSLGNVLVNASLCVPIEQIFRGIISGKWVEQGCNVSRPTFRMHACLWSHRRAIFEVWDVFLSCWNQNTSRSVTYLSLRCVQKRSSISFDHRSAIATVDPSAARPNRGHNAPDSERISCDDAPWL